MNDKLKRFWESPLLRMLSLIILTVIIIIILLTIGYCSKSEPRGTDVNMQNSSAPDPASSAQRVIPSLAQDGLLAYDSSSEPASQSISSQEPGIHPLEPEEDGQSDDLSDQLMLSADTETVDKLSRALSNNSDTVGWLSIDGTKCDYAVMQSDDNKYYLKRNEKKKKSSRGALFADFRCDFNSIGDVSRNTVIYGHSMKDGSMFTQLFAYKKLSVLNNQPIVEFSYNGCTQNKWVIFACMVTDINFNYIEPNPSDAQFTSMVDEIRKRSIFDTDVEVSRSDNILLLSTCTYEYPDHEARFVVAARQLREGENERSIKVNAVKNEDVKKPRF